MDFYLVRDQSQCNIDRLYAPFDCSDRQNQQQITVLCSRFNQFEFTYICLICDHSGFQLYKTLFRTHVFAQSGQQMQTFT